MWTCRMRAVVGDEHRRGGTAERRPRWCLLPQGACPAGMHPPLSSSQSPLNSVSACGENCARSLAPPLPTARGAARAPYLVLPKEKRAVRGPKRKAFGALRCSGPPRARGSAYRCLLRFCLAFGHAWVFCEVDTAVPWRMVPRSSGCKAAFDQLLFYCLALRRSQYFRHQCSTGSSFRAFRLPARGTPHP